jgi:putative ABC transport system permease protein
VGVGATAALGRVLGPEDGTPGAPAALVLGYPLWQRAFGGDPGVVGRSLRPDGWEQPATVVGVMPRGFGFPQGAELWAPIDASLPRHVGLLFVVGRLAPGATPRSWSIPTIPIRLEPLGEK